MNLFKRLTLVVVLSVPSLALAEFDKEKFQAYLDRMQEEEKPATLIVGCGHKNSHHNHEDHWCVDVADFNSHAGPNPDKMTNWGTPGDKKHWETIGADAQLDISAPFLPLVYKDKFDIVVFEHVHDVVSRSPVSLANAYYMIKISGKLFVELRHGHSFRLYESIDEEIYQITCELDIGKESTNASILSDVGIKGLKEDRDTFDTDDGEGKKTLDEYIEKVENFFEEHNVEYKKGCNEQNFMTVIESLGFKNIIPLLVNSTYVSPFSKERTPVIYAEKNKISPQVFRKLYGKIKKHKIAY